MYLTDLTDDILDAIICRIIHLVDLMGARSACRQLHARVNQGFLPVIAPPSLKLVPVLSMDAHGHPWAHGT